MMKFRKVGVCFISVLMMTILFFGCTVKKDNADPSFDETEIVAQQKAENSAQNESGQTEADPDSDAKKSSEAEQSVPEQTPSNEADGPKAKKEEAEAQKNEQLNPEKTSDNQEKTEQEPVLGKAEAEKENSVCTLSVRCDIILLNLEKLKPEKRGLVPADGVIYEEKEVEFAPGESVFDVLLREMKNAKIHMEFSETPAYKSAYVEGINNLYEFDCGELSGWMYRVNGKVANKGCSAYILKPGDRIEWIYTCDRGRDVGENIS